MWSSLTSEIGKAASRGGAGRQVPNLSLILRDLHEIDGDTLVLLSGKLLAWIEEGADDAVQACFIGVAPEVSSRQDCVRAPALLLCRSRDDAQRWVEQEAVALGCPIEWVETRQVSELRA